MRKGGGSCNPTSPVEAGAEGGGDRDPGRGPLAPSLDSPIPSTSANRWQLLLGTAGRGRSRLASVRARVRVDVCRRRRVQLERFQNRCPLHTMGLAGATEQAVAHPPARPSESRAVSNCCARVALTPRGLIVGGPATLMPPFHVHRGLRSHTPGHARVRGGGKLRSAIFRNFPQFRNFSQFSAIFRNFPQFPAIFPQFFAIGFDPPRPQFPPPPARERPQNTVVLWAWVYLPTEGAGRPRARQFVGPICCHYPQNFSLLLSCLVVPDFLAPKGSVFVLFGCARLSDDRLCSHPVGLGPAPAHADPVRLSYPPPPFVIATPL